MAGRGGRLIGYLIDLVPILLLGLAAGYVNGAEETRRPFLALSGAWILLRDLAGTSPGKRLLGLRVVGPDNRPAGIARLVVRNVTLALGPALAATPWIEPGLLRDLAQVIAGVDSFVLLGDGERRLGDMIAGTRVVLRSEFAQ